jgi:hypothetical protein
LASKIKGGTWSEVFGTGVLRKITRLKREGKNRRMEKITGWKCYNNIKMDLNKEGWEGLDWMK